MALVKFTAAVDAISGKINGSVFAKNKGGAYIRSRGQVLNPKTNLQSVVRSAFGAISRLWSQLTPEQRQEWRETAPVLPYFNRLGDQKVYSGKALFQKLNQNLSTLGLPAILDAPQAGEVRGFADDFVNFDGEIGGEPRVFGISFAVPLEEGGDDTRYSLEATPPLTAGTSNANNKFRKIAVSDSPLLASNQVSANDFFDNPGAFGEALEAKFGRYEVGDQIQIRIRPINSVTGQAGVPIVGKTIIEAGE